ncbi:B-cell receptor CD22-like [Sinocyclocheilus grahami]|uniref:B-cell receptor CD22-like n=1 Tax=Sinocyclocheilus grahami TaxID=75366 RepID=UPI0007AD52FC|nr:PREDICTED: B-cell receptor CD22-like [Sinocyclocheilus grahami]
MATSLITSLPLILVIMTAAVDGQQDWGVNYSPSYVCALKGSTVKMSCAFPQTQCQWRKNGRNRVVAVVLSDLQVETQQSVKERDSVTLRCKSSCSLPQQTTFIWYRNTQRLTTGTVDVNQLQLQSVRRADAGNYRCAVSGYEHLISPPVYLKVESVDGQQDWGVNYSPSYVCALKGSTVKMSCALKYPRDHKIKTVFWTKPAVTDGDLPPLCLVPENRGRVQCVRENEDNHNITLTDVTEADKHIYYCRFITNIDTGKWTGVPGAQLDVTDLQVETQQSVKERDSVTLRCKSSCSLPEQTTFIWYRNTQRLTTGTVNVNQLQLQSVSRADEGNYRCAVSGYEHLISPPVYLKVEYPPRNVSVSINGSGEIVEGDSVTLSCSSDSNPPALNFSWFKENQSSAVGSGQSFSISSFNSSHSGRYYCEAQNKHGSQRSESVSVSVKEVQRAALQTVTGIVVGCGGLIFIIIIIVVFFSRKKRRDGGTEVVSQNQDQVARSAETALTNDVPVYSVVSANQRDDLYSNIKAKKPKRSGREQTEKDSGDVEEVQYASVHHFKNKDMNKTEETIEMQHPSDANRAEDVIYSSVK